MSILSSCLRANWGLVAVGGFLRLSADLVGFGGALGIQFVVDSISDGNNATTTTTSIGEEDEEKFLFRPLTLDDFFGDR